ncbi:hypothetical protein BC936DRAFT_147594 [Jimgerdemannia flammicorona]|uniref:Uncharacterized protein n=1 Tax=Jimgerdemannia flammicorona TaxID=994334 RepID=A0A433D4Z1_9FUNG|nr:hypothetical protein BC936DRAFT_147594 [Jimgerdemannia flammicorona]
MLCNKQTRPKPQKPPSGDRRSETRECLPDWASSLTTAVRVDSAVSLSIARNLEEVSELTHNVWRQATIETTKANRYHRRRLKKRWKGGMLSWIECCKTYSCRAWASLRPGGPCSYARYLFYARMDMGMHEPK